MTAVPETTPPDLLAQLAAMRTRAQEERSYLNLAPGDEASPADDVLRLLAIPEALLKAHQPGTNVIFGGLCKRHENHRFFSITATEAQDVRDCGDCEAAVDRACTGCVPQVDVRRCPVRALIAAALAPATEDETP